MQGIGLQYWSISLPPLCTVVGLDGWINNAIHDDDHCDYMPTHRNRLGRAVEMRVAGERSDVGIYLIVESI